MQITPIYMPGTVWTQPALSTVPVFAVIPLEAL